MPTEVQTPGAWVRLADAFRLTGRHRLLLDEVIVPVAIIENLAPEDPLANLRFAQGGIAAQGAVATVAQCQLFNPAGSTVVLDLYQVSFASNTSSVAYQMGPVAAALASDNPAQWQDRRLVAGSIPVGRMQSAITAAAATLVAPVLLRGLQSTHHMIENLRVTLEAGDGYMVETSTVNERIITSFWWSERDV